MEDFQQKDVALDKMKENIDQIISLDFYDDEKRIELLSEVFENAKIVLKDYNPIIETSELYWINAYTLFSQLIFNYIRINIHKKYDFDPFSKKLLISDFKSTEFYCKIDSKERAFWIEHLESVLES